MAIVQISKIIHRTGAITDLPQLDIGELGYATDDQRLFVGDDPTLHPPPTEGEKTNTEIYTDKSTNIPLSKLSGSANTVLDLASVKTGQLLVANGNVSVGSSWTNWDGNLLGPDNIKLQLGQASNIKINGGTNGYFLQTDGLGNLTWTDSVGAVTIAGTPGGSNTQLQFNNANDFGGSEYLTFDLVTRVLTIDGNINSTGYINSSTAGSHNGPVGDVTPNSGAFTSLVASTTAIIDGNLTAGNVSTGGNVTVTDTVNTANVNASDTITADLIIASHNGDGTNFKVGDDAWIGDINVENTLLISGVQDSNNAFIVFGNAELGSTLGRSGTGPLTYKGDFTSEGNVIANNATVTNDLTATTLGGTLTTEAQPNVTSLGELTSLTVNGTANLGAVGNIKITGGSDGFLMRTDGLGNVSWTSNSALLTKPAGSNTQIQFNDGGNAFGSTSTLTFNKTTNTVTTTNGVFLGNAYVGGNAAIVGTLGIGDSLTVTANASFESITTSNITATGNISATGSVSGNGAGLSSLTGANVTGTVANATSATTAGTVTTAAQPNITSIGTLVSLTATGTISAGNISTTGSVTTARLSAGNVTANLVPNANATINLGNTSRYWKDSFFSGNLITGNADLGNAATANFFIGSGEMLTSIAGANVSGEVANATYAVSSATAGTVTEGAQANITSVGTLGNLTIGNIGVAAQSDVVQILSSTNNLYVSTDTTGVSVLSKPNQSGSGLYFIDTTNTVSVLIDDGTGAAIETVKVSQGELLPASSGINLGNVSAPWENVHANTMSAANVDLGPLTMFANVDGLFVTNGTTTYSIALTPVV